MSMSESHAVVTLLPPTIAHPLVTARRTVLLAEDDAAVRRYLEVTLRRAGYSVICAANGLEAIKAALSNDIDAVVTDALMPHLGGHELCRYLRARPELAHLPVLLLSGLGPHGEAQHDERARRRASHQTRARRRVHRLPRPTARRGKLIRAATSTPTQSHSKRSRGGLIFQAASCCSTISPRFTRAV